jgi:hypothetical protein
MWTEVSTGKYTYVRNVTNEQILARYLLLGTDLQELLSVIDDSVRAKEYLEEIIFWHKEVWQNARV